MKILVLDNYDSFTYNLVHLIRELGYSDLTVLRNDRISVGEVQSFDRVILSPGPGIPVEAGIMPELIRTYAPSKPILGVCLGHQCIGEVFGGTLVNMKEPCHGKGLLTRIIKEDEPLFRGIPREFSSARYHSWIVSRESFPESLQITAEDDEGRIMALSHRAYHVQGVQFHPESILTEHGTSMIRNWMQSEVNT